MPPTNAVSDGVPASIIQLFWCWQYSRGRAIPADAQRRPARAQQLALGRGAPEGAARSRLLSGLCRQNSDAHVDAARGRAIEQVEQRAAPVGEAEVLVVEGDGEPDAVARRFDRLADPPERLAAADQRPHRLPSRTG